MTSDEFHDDDPCAALITAFVEARQDGVTPENYWAAHAKEFQGDIHYLCELFAFEFRRQIMSATEAERRDEQATKTRYADIARRFAAYSPNEDQRALLVQLMDGESDECELSDTYQWWPSAHKIDDGGRKSVYRAWQAKLGRHVALKVPLSNDRRLREFLEIESRILGLLNHQNIPAVHAFSHTEGGDDYLVEALIEGASWRDRLIADQARLRAAAKARDSSPEKLADDRRVVQTYLEWHVGVLKEVCSAVLYLHECHELAHVDIKPENVVIRQIGRPAGRAPSQSSAQSNSPSNSESAGAGLPDLSTCEVFLTDFGEAVFFGTSQPVEGILSPRCVVNEPEVTGTTGYRSPELQMYVDGLVDAADVHDWRAIDVYALGATLRDVCDGFVRSVVRNGVVSSDPQASDLRVPGDVSVELRGICSRAMAADPQARHGSVAEFIEDLDRYLRNRQAAVGIEIAAEEQTKWSAAVADILVAPETDPTHAKADSDGLISRGQELAHRITAYCEQILGRKWSVDEIEQDRFPALADGLTSLRAIWSQAAQVAERRGDLGLAISMLRNLEVLPSDLQGGGDGHPAVVRLQGELDEQRRRLRQASVVRLALGGVAAMLLVAMIVVFAQQRQVDVSQRRSEASRRAAQMANDARIHDGLFARKSAEALAAGTMSVASRIAASGAKYFQSADSQRRQIEMLSRSLVPHFERRLYDLDDPEASIQGDGVLGPPFRLTVSHHSHHASSGLLVSAGVSRKQRMNFTFLPSMQPARELQAIPWEVPVDDGVLVAATAPSPDRARLAVGLSTGELRVLDMKTGRVLREVDAHTLPSSAIDSIKRKLGDFPIIAMTHIAWSRDAKFLATHGALDGRIRVWNSETLVENEVKSPPLRSGESLISTSVPQFVDDHRLVYARNMASQTRGQHTDLVLADLLNETASVFSTSLDQAVAASVSRTGRFVAVGGQGAIEVWRCEDDRDNASLKCRFDSTHRAAGLLHNLSDAIPEYIREQIKTTDANTIAMDFSFDERLLAFTRGDGTLTVVSIQDRQILGTGIGVPPTSAFTDNSFPFFTSSGELFTTGLDGRILYWEFARDRIFPPRELDDTRVPLSIVGSDGCFYPRANSHDQFIQWIDAEDAMNPLVFEEPVVTDLDLATKQSKPIRGTAVNVCSVPGRRKAAAALKKGGLAIVDMSSGSSIEIGASRGAIGDAIANVTGGVHGEGAFAIDASLSGEYAAANHAAGGLVVVDVDAARTMCRFGTGTYRSIAFQPSNSDVIATARNNGAIEIWNWRQPASPWKTLVTGVAVSIAPEGVPDGGLVAFSADGKYLVGTAGDSLRLYETAKWREVAKWQGHGAVPFAGSRVVNMQALAFSPQGRATKPYLFASLAADGDVRLWEIQEIKNAEQPVAVVHKATLPTYSLRSYQYEPELVDEFSVKEGTSQVSNLAALRFLPGHKLFVDSNSITPHIYDLSAVEAMLTKKPGEMIALNEQITGLTIRDDEMRVVNGLVESKDIRVEFDRTRWSPQPIEDIKVGTNAMTLLELINRSQPLLNLGKLQEAEDVYTRYLIDREEEYNSQEVKNVLLYRALSRLGRRNFDGAIADCDKILVGVELWHVSPSGSISDAQELTILAARALAVRALALRANGNHEAALQSSLMAAHWTGRGLSRPDAHLRPPIVTADLREILVKSLHVATSALSDLGRPEEAMVLSNRYKKLLDP